MLAEHLRRVIAVRFEPGVLELRGPKFNVGSLENKDNLERLKKALVEYSKITSWKVTLEAGEQGEVKGSLVQAERAQVAEKRKQTEDAITNHPKIKSLQRVFPGSSIEDIKVKD